MTASVPVPPLLELGWQLVTTGLEKRHQVEDLLFRQDHEQTLGHGGELRGGPLPDLPRRHQRDQVGAQQVRNNVERFLLLLEDRPDDKLPVLLLDLIELCNLGGREWVAVIISGGRILRISVAELLELVLFAERWDIFSESVRGSRELVGILRRLCLSVHRVYR